MDKTFKFERHVLTEPNTVIVISIFMLNYEFNFQHFVHRSSVKTVDPFCQNMSFKLKSVVIFLKL